MPRLDEQQDDDVARFLDEFERDLRQRLAGVAEVARDDYGGVHVNPSWAYAAFVGWLEHFNELLLWVSGGGRWEMLRDLESAKFVREVVEAVIQGRVSEFFGPGRSAVTVRLSAGTDSTSVGTVSGQRCRRRRRGAGTGVSLASWPWSSSRLSFRSPGSRVLPPSAGGPAGRGFPVCCLARSPRTLPSGLWFRSR